MANARIKYHANEHSILYAETGGCCPLCTSPMMFKKASSRHPSIGYEIAHIFPLNPNKIQEKSLEGYKVPDDINSLDNVILLCPSCHTKYDKDFKVEEYLKLLQIKNGYLSETKARLTASQHVLQGEVCEILDLIVRVDGNFGDLSETKLDVSSLNGKLKSDISPLQKREIQSNVIDFFVPIRNHIRLIEQIDQAAIRILQNQINSYYLVIDKQNPRNKDLVFNYVSQWICLKSGRSLIASKILTSFFIQNCEVFDADSN
ncbi:ABC-three component system protein [Citrobacter youngae]|uniref:ABC-three component system protein n=1 Tax=Citrobacter youngae TaxID=133448 RepID=UPI003EE190E8